MKRSLLFIFASLYVTLSCVAAFAQDPRDTILDRIIYTNSERTAILGKTVGWNKVDTLFTSYISPNGPQSSIVVKNLAVLASTPDGNSLLIGGKAVFYNGLESHMDSGWAIARLDAPFKNTGTIGITISSVTSTIATLTIGGAKVLKFIITNQNLDPFPSGKMLPIGVLTGNDWYVTPQKNSCSQQWFFHGKFNGFDLSTSVVDSVLVTGDPATFPGHQGFHMSNLVTNDDGSVMLCVIFDGIKAAGAGNVRAQVFSWQPNPPPGDFAFQARDISDQIQSLTRWDIDSSFCFLLRKIPQQNYCEIGLSPKGNGNIEMYQFPVSGSISGLQGPNLTIPRNKLPKDVNGNPLHFFTGRTGEPASDTDHFEVINPATGIPVGNGGDIMFNADQSKVVFITCSSGDLATTTESGIYIMDLQTGKVDSVINDRTKMERQPIFTAPVVHKFIQPPPPNYVLGTASADSTALVFGGDTVMTSGGTTQTLQSHFTIKTNNASEIILTKGILNGNNGGAFTLVSPTQSQLQNKITIKGGSSQAFTVSFTPPSVGTFSATLEIHYNDSLTTLDGKNRPDSVIMVSLSGTGIKQVITGGGNAVQLLAPASFDLSISPNPFTASTVITVSARITGSSSLEIRDLLGKDIYSSKPFLLGTGEKYTYTLDGNAMHLAPGIYFVIVRSGTDEVTRQAVYVK